MIRFFLFLPIALMAATIAPVSAQSVLEKPIECEVLIVGGGLGGVAAAFDALRLEKQVCMTEITDWIGGQVSQQGVSALDEEALQRELGLFPLGYRRFRVDVQARYGGGNPGKCWVSELCFSPQTGVQVLEEMLAPYQQSGKLVLLKNTVVKDLEVRNGLIRSALALTHLPKSSERGVNSLPLSHFIEDWYNVKTSALFNKQTVRLEPPARRQGSRIPWMVIDAAETGELLPLAGAPYRLGTDLQTPQEPSARAAGADPYCTQAFTYPFAIEKTDKPESPVKPADYDSPYNSRFYSFGERKFTFSEVFTYRRIRGKTAGKGPEALSVGDQSIQNWTWGNDWRLSTATTNLVLTQEQLQAEGQVSAQTPQIFRWSVTRKGDWRGGLRTSALAAAEAHAYGYYYWLVAGTQDALLQKEDPLYRKPTFLDYALLKGVESPLGTEHGLSRYPYIREGRRLLGRPFSGYPNGFTVYETDLAGSALNAGRPRLFFDSVGIGQYRIDDHSCIINKAFEASPYDSEKTLSPKYPFFIPLRALIPQNIDNLLAGSKNIATSHITNGAYRVHPVEWAIGAAAGNTATFALQRDIVPASLVSSSQPSKLLKALQTQILNQGNPIRFP
jgi:FAD dependent oxidoreductase